MYQTEDNEKSVSYTIRAEFTASELDALAKDLSAANFDPYLTAVGGSGLGILSPYEHESLTKPTESATPLTPPETPAEDPAKTPLLRDEFANVSAEELSKWAEQRGRWLFV